MSEDCKCGHEKYAHADEYNEKDEKVGDFTGKCLMWEDGCRCRKYKKIEVTLE